MRNCPGRAGVLRGACLSALLGLAIASGARAESIECVTEDVPVDRLPANLEALAARTPDSWEAQYALGRAHSIAYARKTPSLSACGSERDGNQMPVLSSRGDLGDEHRQPEIAPSSGFVGRRRRD